MEDEKITSDVLEDEDVVATDDAEVDSVSAVDVENVDEPSDGTDTDIVAEEVNEPSDSSEKEDIRATYEDIDFDKLMKKKGCARFFKRMFDIVMSSIGLIFCIIPFFFIAIAIRCTSKGPVYFRQVRVGKNGKEFRIFKFRTMVVDAEKKGKQITVGNDSRITGIGKFLRKTKMDELPQLINVLLGQMSFVGPRPEVPKYVAMYNDYERNILRIKPGITELASITYRDENEVLAASENPEDTYINEIMPKKLNLNMQYMKKMNVFYDIYLIFKTFGAILK